MNTKARIKLFTKVFLIAALFIFSFIQISYSNRINQNATTIIYVNATATGSNNGTSWANAFTKLQDGITAATSGNEIWVAAGTYYPDEGVGFTNNDRTASFKMKNNVAILGGFPSIGNPILVDRNSKSFISSLNGDIDQDNSVLNNAYTIINNKTSAFISESSILDGFTIEGGNNTITTGIGGGMHNAGNNPLIRNCVFQNNFSLEGGAISNGGVTIASNYGYMTRPAFLNCLFKNNSSNKGAVLYCYDSSNDSKPSFVNCLFQNNVAAERGGIVYINSVNQFSNYGVYPKFTNCTFSGNQAQIDDSIISFTGNGKGRAIINNSIIYGNTNGMGSNTFANNSEIVNCILELSISGFANGNIKVAETPFVSLNDFTLKPNSPAINIGNTFLYQISADYQYPHFLPPTMDLDGKQRTITSILDIGAFEYNCNENIEISATPNSILPFGINVILSATNCNSPNWYDYSNGSLNLLPDNMPLANPSKIFYAKCGDVFNCTAFSVPFPLTLPSSFSESTHDVSLNSFISPNFNLIANIQPIAPSPVSGEINAKVWIENNTIPGPFVKRHYQITPTNNPYNSTARITLYFTVAEFNDYNLIATADLPAFYNDDAGKSNLRIHKISGSSFDAGGLDYGQNPTIETINPDDADIKYANGQWEVSFDVSSFSGFFVNSANNVLPINLISFSGKASESGNLLTWKAANESNFRHFEVEKSINSKVFDKIGVMMANKSENYNFLDKTTFTYLGQVTNFYRLKQVDNDGTFSYSKIIAVQSFDKQFTIGNFYPNPSFQNETFIDIQSVENENINIKYLDFSGKVLKTESKWIAKGKNTIKINLDILLSHQSIIQFSGKNFQEHRKLQINK